jgi:hypothetical protein
MDETAAPEQLQRVAEFDVGQQLLYRQETEFRLALTPLKYIQ